MREWLEIIGWLACVIYSTIPLFWLMIHPFAGRWRARRRSPYRLLLPAWMAMWAAMAGVTAPGHRIPVYRGGWLWAPGALHLVMGLFIHSPAGQNFSEHELGGVPAVHVA